MVAAVHYDELSSDGLPPLVIACIRVALDADAAVEQGLGLQRYDSEGSWML